MKKFLFLLSFILLVFASCAAKTSVKTSIIVDVIPENQIDTSSLFSLYKNIFKIQQTFKLQNFQENTILFILEANNNAWLNQIFYQKLKVFSINGNTKDTIGFTFSENEIKCAVPSKNCKISVEYYFQPDYLIYGETPMQVPLTRVSSTWHSWYFITQNIEFEKIQINMPSDKNKSIITSLPQITQKDNKLYLDCKKITYYGVTFLIVESEYYQKFNIKIDNNIFNIYAFKGVEITSDSTSLSTMYPPKDTIFDVSKFKNYLLPISNIERIFNKKIAIDIVDCDYSMTDCVVGQGYTVNKNNGFVVMDTSFWKISEGIHEIIHLYNNIMPDKNDLSFYFFNESMTEFLCSYFYYSTDSQRDSVFNYKNTYYNEHQKNTESIFKVAKNEPVVYNDDTTKYIGGTYGIVYQKTPYKLYQLAKNVGEEKFMGILQKFYHNVKKKHKCSFVDFEKIMKQNGVTNAQWNDFIKDL